MYPFNKVKEQLSWRLELNGISIVTENFEIKEDFHWFNEPRLAIGYFNIDGNLYGLSNSEFTKFTAEEFFDVMNQHYQYFNMDQFSDSFFREYGFVLSEKNWGLDLTDQQGIHSKLEFRNEKDWYFDNHLMEAQPRNVADIMHFFAKKTGRALKRIA